MRLQLGREGMKRKSTMTFLLLLFLSLSSAFVVLPQKRTFCTVSSFAVFSTNTNEDKTTSPNESSYQWLSMDPDEMTVGEKYGLCISTVVPRPVAVITSISNETGQVNCAPFSFTSLSTHDPPIVTHGICTKNGGTVKKDTLLNIEETGEWVYNVLTTEYLEKANACAASLDVDETKEVGLETMTSKIVKPPRLLQAAVSLECKLIDKKEIFNDEGIHTTTIVFGRVVQFHVRNDVTFSEDSTKVDLQKLQAVGRAGGSIYWPVGIEDDLNNMLIIPRPS